MSDRSGLNQIYALDPLQPESPSNPPKLFSDGTSDDEAPAWRVPRRGFTVGTYPSQVFLAPSQSQQFNVFVTGTSNQAVNWSISPAVGTVSSSGLYKAPATVSTPLSVTVTATSVVDSAKFAGSTIVLSVVKLAPPSLNFGRQTVGTTSPPKTVTLTNTGSTALSVAGISVLGINATDFSETNTCGTSVGPGLSCSINVTFTPAAKGIRSAAVSISDSGGNSPQVVSLSGTGT